MDPVGSAFIGVRIQGYIIQGKAEFNQPILGYFVGNYMFEVWN